MPAGGGCHHSAAAAGAPAQQHRNGHSLHSAGGSQASKHIGKAGCLLGAGRSWRAGCAGLWCQAGGCWEGQCLVSRQAAIGYILQIRAAALLLLVGARGCWPGWRMSGCGAGGCWCSCRQHLCLPHIDTELHRRCSGDQLLPQAAGGTWCAWRLLDHEAPRLAAAAAAKRERQSKHGSPAATGARRAVVLCAILQLHRQHHAAADPLHHPGKEDIERRWHDWQRGAAAGGDGQEVASAG